MTLKTAKINGGKYSVTCNGHCFVLEKLFGDRNWRLYNSSDVEVLACETKSGMLEVMRSWSAASTSEKATQEFCTYA